MLHFFIIRGDICNTYLTFVLLDFPFNQLPVLEVDGTVISQSHTIERYLARKFGRLNWCDLKNNIFQYQIPAFCALGMHLFVR